MTGVAVRCQRHVTGSGMIDGVIIPGPATMTIRTDRSAAGTAGCDGYQRQILVTGMTGRTCIMLDVVSRIGKQRIVNGCGMTVKAGCLGVHKVACIMINVMGEQVKGRTVIDVAVTTGTVTTADTAGCCRDQAVVVGTRIRMTGGTGVMDRVVSRIY